MELALGGSPDLTDVHAYLAGLADVSDIDHDIVTQASTSGHSPTARLCRPSNSRATHRNLSRPRRMMMTDVPPEFGVSIVQVDGHVTARVSGELDLATASTCASASRR